MTSAERLREVVAVYQQAKADGRSVHGAIARHFGTSQQDAKSLIKEARDHAFLTTYQPSTEATAVIDFKRDLSDPNRCVSVHWALPAQCELPSSHRENWHETRHPETGNRLRYNYPSSRTQELIHGEWHAVSIPKPVPEDERKLREEIADAIASLKSDYRSVEAFTALNHAEQIARGPLLRQGYVVREECAECTRAGDARTSESPRGNCRCCGRNSALLIDGRVRRHGGYVQGRRLAGDCPGSYQEPADDSAKAIEQEGADGAA